MARNKKFHGFTLSPETVEEFRKYAVSIGSNASYEVERLMRKEIDRRKIISVKLDDKEKEKIVSDFLSEMWVKYLDHKEKD